MKVNNWLLIVFLSLFVTPYGWGQVLDNQKVVSELKQGIECVYNFDFEDGRLIAEKLRKEYPGHPAYYLFEAIYTYWADFPVTTAKKSGEKYTTFLEKTVELSDGMLNKDEDDSEALFYNMISRLMLMQFWADNRQPTEVVPHITSTYRKMMKGRELTEELQDFNFSSGIYNYYRVAYPENYPFYKAFVFLFPKGDKKKGIQQLKQAWKQAIFVSPEAMSFLAYIYIYFENDGQEGKQFSQQLVDKYPNNPLYISYHIQMLLLEKQYYKASIYVNDLKLKADTNSYFNACWRAYQGIIEEHHHQNYSKAEKEYRNAVRFANEVGSFANTPKSFGYFGLSRIHKRKGQLDKVEYYKDLAEDISNYPKVNFD
ncbi:MAG: hypothetical protein MI922_18835 [Bacteroidales bacterium]|nr:hypothetical protein [Bacteroidales bacterium]